MAGDWMMIDLELSDKPEVHQIARILEIDPDAVVGKLIRVWSWFDKQSRDGHARGVTKKLLERVTGVTAFGDAMEKAGWLHSSEDGISMPRFDTWNGQSAKKRALANRRQSRKRHANVTQMSRSLRDKNVTREEKRLLKEADPEADASPDPIWGPGLEILLTAGVPEKHARPFIGSLLGLWESSDVLAALQAASGKADPRGYVRGVLRSVPKKGQRSELKVAMP